MLVEILTYHQVMPAYLDFLMLFGQSNNRNSLRYSGFCEQTSLDPANASFPMDHLGRSGRHFELCYNLKTVDLNPDRLSSAESKWSVRQASIYHKFDVVEGTTLWIITKGSLDLKNRVQQVTGNNGRQEDRTFGTPTESFRASLAIHMMTVHWAGESWRWYIQWLEELIEKEVRELELPCCSSLMRNRPNRLSMEREKSPSRTGSILKQVICKTCRCMRTGSSRPP
jgi:hypothetical protein